MSARQNAHHFATTHIHTYVGTNRIHHINGFSFAQFPRPGFKFVRQRCESAHWAQIDNVALQFRIDRLVQIGGDFNIFTAARKAHFFDACDFGGETHTACALNAAVHFSFNQRA